MNARETEVASMVANLKHLDIKARLICSQFEYYPLTGRLSVGKNPNAGRIEDKRTLYALMLLPNIVVPHGSLYAISRNVTDVFLPENALKTSIARIRGAFKKADIDPDMIGTSKRVGYQFRTGEQIESVGIDIPRFPVERIALDGYDYLPQTYEFEVEDERVRLGVKEVAVFQRLLRTRGVNVPYSAITMSAWGLESDYALIRNTNVHVASLRRKSNKTADTSDIVTVPRVGYRLKAPKTEE